MIDWLGPVLVEYWGATEGGVYATCDSAAWLDRRGTVGRPISAYEVFAVDEQRRRLPPGKIGTLYCRHLKLSRAFEYHNAPDKTEAAHLESGGFTVGDRGYVDDDGFVFITGRSVNMIISGGVNIYPAEIESVLQEHPAVVDVGVYGVPDEEWGEQVRAAVQLASDAPVGPELEEELRRFARQKLASYKVPRQIIFQSKLPRDLNGKLYLGRLRNELAQTP